MRWQTLNNLVNDEAGVSETRILLDKALGGGAETWLRLLMAYDLAKKVFRALVTF